jgi:hypothetical protein
MMEAAASARLALKVRWMTKVKNDGSIQFEVAKSTKTIAL